MSKIINDLKKEKETLNKAKEYLNSLIEDVNNKISTVENKIDIAHCLQSTKCDTESNESVQSPSWKHKFIFTENGVEINGDLKVNGKTIISNGNSENITSSENTYIGVVEAIDLTWDKLKPYGFNKRESENTSDKKENGFEYLSKFYNSTMDRLDALEKAASKWELNKN